MPASASCVSELDMAARRARPRASQHRRVHIHVRHRTPTCPHPCASSASVPVLLLRTRVASHNVAHETSTGHVPVEVVRRAASQWSRWCVMRKERHETRPLSARDMPKLCSVWIWLPKNMEARAAPKERCVTLAGSSLVVEWCAVTACSVQVRRLW